MNPRPNRRAILAGLAYVLWGGGTVPDAEGNTFTPVQEE